MRAWLWVGLIISGLLAGCGGSDEAEERPGSPDVYQRISTMTDCAALQREFDQAEANFNRELAAGESRARFRKIALSYMKAADARMKEAGCYK